MAEAEQCSVVDSSSRPFLNCLIARGDSTKNGSFVEAVKKTVDLLFEHLMNLQFDLLPPLVDVMYGIASQWPSE